MNCLSLVVSCEEELGFSACGFDLHMHIYICTAARYLLYIDVIIIIIVTYMSSCLYFGTYSLDFLFVRV